MSDHTDTVACPNCGHDNAPTQRFCGNCGHSLAVTCPSCEASNPPGFRFCGSCGHAFDQRVRDDPAQTEERRWATVLFGDLSGFTRLSEHTDPEDVRTLIDRSMSKLGEIAETYEGRVERVTGDEIMVVFGAPVAHEDDPERAVRTGLEMQRYAKEQSVEFGELPLRIGINTGEMMFAPVGPKGARHHTVMGDAVNTASRLESAAPLGGVLVGAATHDATKHCVIYQEVEPIHAKGKEEPVEAWVAVECVSEPGARPISEVPILGREYELELLRRVWERVLAEQQPHLVTVIGPPGIGKSKLARAFGASVETGGGRAFWGRSYAYGERVGGAFGQLVRQIANVFVTDDRDYARVKLDAISQELVPDATPDFLHNLAALIGLGEQDEVDRRAIFGAARTFIEALAAQSPCVIVFEDLHWADSSLRELVQWISGHLQQAPVLFLTLARPELLDAEPTWGGGMTSYTALPLGPLPEAQARELAGQLRGDLDGSELQRIERASGGNPLFIEEMAAWFTEDRTHGASPLPANITSIVAARLDALPAHLRRVLLDASVIGVTFWRGGVDRLAEQPDETADALDELVARDLIRAQPFSRVPGDDEFVFKHQVIRDVAYDILPKAARRERHAAFAAYIEERVENTGLVAAILANHWRDSGDGAKAIGYLLEAADMAGRGWEQRESMELLKEALTLLPEGDVALKRQITLKLAVARQIYQHSIMDADSIRRAAAGALEEHHEH